jgi:putative thymidine phosphorylase
MRYKKGAVCVKQKKIKSKSVKKIASKNVNLTKKSKSRVPVKVQNRSQKRNMSAGIKKISQSQSSSKPSSLVLNTLSKSNSKLKSKQKKHAKSKIKRVKPNVPKTVPKLANTVQNARKKTKKLISNTQGTTKKKIKPSKPSKLAKPTKSPKSPKSGFNVQTQTKVETSKVQVQNHFQSQPIFSAKRLGISTGGIRVVVLPKIVVARLSLRAGDRVKLIQTKATKHSFSHVSKQSNKQIKADSKSKESKHIIAILDIATHNLEHSQIGFFDESAQQLQIKDGDLIRVEPYPKPEAVFIIQKKLHGHHLTKDDMLIILKSIMNYELTDIELTYFVSACYHHELSNTEIAHLTQAMIETGNPIDFGKLFPNRPIVDKHCIGGVAANRTTAIVVPILAAAGYIVPKTSSRSITSPAGTSDTIEVLADVCLNRKKIIEVVKKANCCMVWGGALDLAPSDDMIIKVENPISLDPIGQMIASILAKKKSVGSTHVLIDIPVGKGAKIQSHMKALSLKKKFEDVGKLLDINILVIITDGSEPIGNGIGPNLEARDILLTLANDPAGSKALHKKAIDVSAKLFCMLEHIPHHVAVEKARHILETKKAHAVFVKMLELQGLHVQSLDPQTIPVGEFTYTVVANDSGSITHIDNRIISRIAKLAGAPFDKKAGMYLHVHKHTRVKKGDALYTVYTSDPVILERIKEHVLIETGITIVDSHQAHVHGHLSSHNHHNHIQ